jgi:hypothetical protein
MDSIEKAYDVFSQPENIQLSAGEVVHMIESQEQEAVIGVKREVPSVDEDFEISDR